MTPGAIMRQTQATLRHRGFDVDDFHVERLDEAGIIVGSGDIVDSEGVRGRAVVVFADTATMATVMSLSHNLNYVFTPEADEPPSRLRGAEWRDLGEVMDVPVVEAAIAIDDPEGFWHQGDDLDAQGIAILNDRIRTLEGRILGKGPTRWLITFGKGFVYLVEPVEKCSECRQRVYIDEIDDFNARAHSGCYDRNEL